MKIPAFLAVIFLFCLIIPQVSAQNDPGAPHYTVLFLSSYNQGMVFSDEEYRGVRDSLAPLMDSIDFRIEYMDTKRVSGEGYLQSLYLLYRYKYNMTRFDVIIAADNSAFDFLKAHRDDLFPKSPVVFCGVTGSPDDLLSKTNQFTGVMEDKDIRGTLDTALSLFPKTKNVYVIHDQSDTGIATHKYIERFIHEYENRLTFRFITNISVIRLLETVRSLPPDSVIILEAFNRDAEGNLFTHEKIGDLLSDTTRVPMFSNAELYVGHGIVGGNIITGYEQGKYAGDLAVRILQGEPAALIPVVTQSPKTFMFDYPQLSEHGIPESALPPGSIVINKPLVKEVPVWVLYIAVAVIGSMGIVVIVLIIHIRLRRIAEQKLRESERKFRAIFDQTFQLTGLMTVDGKVTHANRTALTQSGIMESEVIGKLFWETPWWTHSPDLQEQVKDAVRKAASGEFTRFEATHPTADGSLRTFDFSIKPVRDESGKVILLIPEGRDISERKMAEEALNQANRKMNLLTFVTFNEIQNAVFSLAGYLELEKQSGLEEPLKNFVEKQENILKSIEESLVFSKKYQSLGLHPPRWQKVTHAFLFGTSHLDISGLKRNIMVDNLEIFADPLLEDCFFTLTENVLIHGKTATEISLGYSESVAGLTLDFEDNGTGVPEDMKEAIFARKYEDKKGLGLFLTREILGITGITIQETGMPGRGAHFEIFIPKGRYRFRKDENPSVGYTKMTPGRNMDIPEGEESE